MLLQPPLQGVRAADVDDAVAGVAHLVHTRIVPVRLHRGAAEMPPRCCREWHVFSSFGGAQFANASLAHPPAPVWALEAHAASGGPLFNPETAQRRLHAG